VNQTEYAAFCQTTDHYPTRIEDADILFHASGMAGEAGEVLNKVKKIWRDDGGEITDERRKAIMKEMGGVYWYFTRLASRLGVTVEEIRDQNADVLLSRQKRGTLLGDGDDR